MSYRAEFQTSAAQGGEVSLRCPLCRQNGTFFTYNNVNDLSWHQRAAADDTAIYYRGGIRICPNEDCVAIVFVVLEGGKLKETFPVEPVDFDPSNLPQKILSAFEEAVTSFSVGCYRASALMIRRVLEEICEDQKIVGKDLNARLMQLGQGSLIPKELIEAAHELRLLGNDAAHIVSKNYDKIGKEEMLASIDLTKEILKSVYQYSSLLSRLRSLKK